MKAAGLMLGGLALMLGAGCSPEPDFDERFDQRANDLAEQARQIETDTNAQLEPARAADKAQANRDNDLPAADQ